MTKIWSVAKSRFACAMALFLCFNFLLNQQDQVQGFAPSTARARLFDYPGAESNVLCLKEPPNILLLGSSLLIRPEWSVDRTLPTDELLVKNTIVSECHYHLARGLGNEFERIGFQNPHVYSLAVGGGLISDSYLLLQRYLNAHPAPQMIILDCAPRSFYDSRITEPDRTPVFDYFFSFQDFCQLHHLYLRTFTAKANYLLSRVCFTYHHRLSLSEAVQQKLSASFPKSKSDPAAISAIAAQAPGTPISSSVAQGHGTPISSTVAQAPGTPISSTVAQAHGGMSIKPAQLVASVPAVQQYSQCSAPVGAPQDQTKLAESLKEYYWRYEGLNPNELVNQMKFLERISEFCALSQIRLVVVNMPLTEANKQLLPAGFYESFTQKLQSTLAAQRTEFVDLASLRDWSSDCFSDSVHMNEKGGMQLNQLLAQAIAQRVPAR